MEELPEELVEELPVDPEPDPVLDELEVDPASDEDEDEDEDELSFLVEAPVSLRSASFVEPNEPAERLSVAVNADSLATWFVHVLANVGDDVTVEVRREDQDRTAQLLRDGTVMAAVTGDGRAVQGCRSVPLGSARYRAMASASFVARHLADVPLGGSEDRRRLARTLATAPAVAFTPEDALRTALRTPASDARGGALDIYLTFCDRIRDQLVALRRKVDAVVTASTP